MEIEAQSKGGFGGPNEAGRFYAKDGVPKEIAEDANRHAPFECECGARIKLAGGSPDLIMLFPVII